MQILKHISIKEKLIFRIAVIYLVSVIISLILFKILFHRSTEEISQQSVSIINDNFSNEVTAEINKAIHTTELLSYIPMSDLSNSSGLTTDQKELTEGIIRSNQDVKGLFIIFFNQLSQYENSDSAKFYEHCLHMTSDGISEKMFDINDFNADFTNFYNLHDDKQIVVSQPFSLRLSNENHTCVTIYTPLYNREKIFGAVGINYSLKEIINITDKQFYNNSNIKQLIIYQNSVIASTGKQFLSSKNILSVEGEEHLIYNLLISNNFKLRSINGHPLAYLKKTLLNTSAEWQFITIVNKNGAIDKLVLKNYLILTIIILLILAGLVLILLFLGRSFKHLKFVTEALSKVSSGEPVNLDNNEPTEFGEIISYVNKVSENLKNASEVCNKIASGNYERNLKPESEKDILAKSINSIIENLQRTSDENKLKEEREYQQLWMRRGRFEIAETERKSEKTIDSLTFNLIRALVNYTGAILGGIYLSDDDLSGLELKAAYAYGNEKHINAEFKAGEGLVGACLVEKKKILLKNVPDDYIRISSGLGSGSPGFLALIPIFFQEKINAVIEIAFVLKPDDYIIEFIEGLGDNIGAWIDSAITGSKTAKLLEVSKAQTGELELKERELNEKVNELEKIQTETAVQNAEYRSMMNAVNNTVMTVEYKLDGTVINSNKIYEEIMGFAIDDIKGINVLELVKDQHSDLKEIINEVAEGKHIKRQVKRYTKSGEVKWLSATYTPYIDKDGNINRVLFFAFDITDMITELQNLKS